MSARALFWAVLLTFTATLELRASTPYAFLVAKWSLVFAAVAGTVVVALGNEAFHFFYKDLSTH